MNEKFEPLSPPENNSVESKIAALREADQTLRMMAKLPPPEGLADRVHVRLRSQQAGLESNRKRSWFALLAGPRWQFATMALVFAALAGGGWNVYRLNHSQVLVAPPHQAAPGGFDSSHEMHVPPTLAPIHVPPAPKKKPAAGRNGSHSTHPPAASSADASKAQPAPAKPNPAQSGQEKPRP
jgi:hypothetical protein